MLITKTIVSLIVIFSFALVWHNGKKYVTCDAVRPDNAFRVKMGISVGGVLFLISSIAFIALWIMY